MQMYVCVHTYITITANMCGSCYNNSHMLAVYMFVYMPSPASGVWANIHSVTGTCNVCLPTFFHPRRRSAIGPWRGPTPSALRVRTTSRCPLQIDPCSCLKGGARTCPVCKATEEGVGWGEWMDWLPNARPSETIKPSPIQRRLIGQVWVRSSPPSQYFIESYTLEFTL